MRPRRSKNPDAPTGFRSHEPPPAGTHIGDKQLMGARWRRRSWGESAADAPSLIKMKSTVGHNRRTRKRCGLAVGWSCHDTARQRAGSFSRHTRASSTSKVVEASQLVGCDRSKCLRQVHAEATPLQRSGGRGRGRHRAASRQPSTPDLVWT